MEVIIVYCWDDETTNECIYEGGIYNNISYNTAVKKLGTENIAYYIPLAIPGKSYQERKNNLVESAKEWQRSNYDFIGWGYSELSIINDFFETNGRRYGLIQEFRENGII